MLSIIYIVALIWVMWKLLMLGIKAAWGIAKIACAVLLLPAFLFGLVCVGLFYVAVPLLIIVGIVVLICGAVMA